MVGKRKIVDEGEVRDWIEEGKPYRWMVSEYDRKYNLPVSVSMFSEFRSTRGLTRRVVRDPELIPWMVKPEHRIDTILANLRTEARVRAGEAPEDLSYGVRTRWQAFKRRLEEGDLVVHYDPDTEDGFFLVPRQPEDTDIIRRPKRRPSGGRGRRD